MLVLSRKIGEGIIIGNDVKITILEIHGGVVRIGVDAPKTKKVYRLEIYGQIFEQMGKH